MAQKPPRSSQKLYFLLLWRTLKMHNLTSTNAILMNLTTIIILMRPFNWPKIGAQEGVKQKPQKMCQKTVFQLSFHHFLIIQKKKHNIYDTLPGIALLVKISNICDPILGIYGQETTQSKPKIVFPYFQKHLKCQNSQATSHT